MPAIETVSATIAQRVAQTLADASTRPTHTLPSLLPLVYHELRRVGRAMLRQEREGHTLQATAIVNEAYLRLAGIDLRIHDRKHCLMLMTQTMRRVLIDHAKGKLRIKRDQPTPEALETLVGPSHNQNSTSADIVDIDTALCRMADFDPEAVEMIQLHYQFGVDPDELAAVFRMSEASVTRKLRAAKAWLASYFKAIDGTSDAREGATGEQKAPAVVEHCPCTGIVDNHHL